MSLVWPVKILLTCAVLICLVSVQPMQLAPAEELSHQPWYKAWYKEEIESDLSNLEFNATLCPEWYKHIPEKHSGDYQYGMEIGELCDRLSENEADHYEAEKEYQSDLKKRKRLRESLVDVIIKLSNSTAEKIEQLTARTFPKLEDNDTCYLTVYKTFSESCVNPELDPNVKKYRRVFANACTQNWLDEDTICQQIHKTCDERDLN